MLPAQAPPPSGRADSGSPDSPGPKSVGGRTGTTGFAVVLWVPDTREGSGS
jgi:hypothetical protein